MSNWEIQELMFKRNSEDRLSKPCSADSLCKQAESLRGDNEVYVISMEEDQEEDLTGSNGSIEESFSRTRPPEGPESGTDSPSPELNGTSFQAYNKATTSAEEVELNIPSSPTLSPPVRQDV